MLSQTECKEVVDISTKVINKYSKNWNKCTVFTGYCHNNYGSFSLFYQDSESKQVSYWGELYSDIANNEMYSFEGYNYINEILKKYYTSCQNDLNLRWNKGTLTIYPSGEYESSFIWDNEAYLGRLGQSVETWLSSVYQYACERIQDRCSELSIDIPNEVEMSVSFDKLGVSQPAMFYTKDVPQINFKLHSEQIYGYYERPYEEEFTEYDTIREPIENDPWDCQIHYQMTNEGELKGYYPRWNKLIFSLNPNDQYSFSYEKLKFEWIEDLA